MRNLKPMTTSLLGEYEIVDITDQLPKQQPWETLPKKNIVRGSWDGTMHTGYRLSGDIDTIVIHHAGVDGGTIESHAKYHARKWGAGIAYHLIIDKGRIYQTNNLLSFTFHAGGNNTYTVGICVNRNLQNGDLTEEERKLLYGAILSVKRVLPIQHIKGHKELQKTACPVTSVERIRKDIASLEEQIDYHSSKDDNMKIYEMVKRIGDLYEKQKNPHDPYQAEATRKLSVIYDVLKEKQWF